MDVQKLKDELISASTVLDLFDSDSGKGRLSAMTMAAELIGGEAISTQFVCIDVPRDAATPSTLLHALMLGTRHVYHLALNQTIPSVDFSAWPLTAITEVRMFPINDGAGLEMQLGLAGRDCFPVKALGLKKSTELREFAKAILAASV